MTADRSLGVLELDSVARGIEVTDAILKEAPVRLAAATPATPGRFFVAFWGDEASVAYAHRRGLARAGDTRVDDLVLAVVDAQVVPALGGVASPDRVDALGVVELPTATDTVRVADGMAKATSIGLIEIVVSRGLAGKGFVTFAGRQADVEDAIATGRELGTVVGHATLANPDPELVSRVVSGAWGEIEGRRLY